MELFIEKIISKEIILSIITVVVGIIIYFITKKICDMLLQNKRHSDKKSKTYIKLINNILKYIIFIVVILVILQIFGINVTSIVAGLGIVSVIAGLALQDALKDIIMGFNILMDGYFAVGDTLKINDFEGKVIELGLKSTKLKDINNGNILIIANRNITEALNLSDMLDIDIPLPYEEKLSTLEPVLNEIVSKIEKLENVISVSYKGLKEFGDSAIYYKIRMFVKPEFKPQVKLNANHIIKEILDEKNISIPYNQLDIHTK